VIAGSARGRRLVAPVGDSTRPTADRVREATFNALHSLGALEGARVVDLFAGSGALGIEALSRGAAHATFVDRDRRAVDAITANLATTGLADAATVQTGTVERALAEAARAGERWSLALVDPPYAFDEWEALLVTIPADLVVAESGRPVAVPDGWRAIRQRQYGATLVAILHPQPPAGSPRGPDLPE
jgi:16S rRNA (guanine966-N2)-methyltransferase